VIISNQIILPHATWQTFIARYWHWETYIVNRTCIIVDTRFGYKLHKNTWCRYCKIDTVWYLYVYETSDYTIFIHIRTLYSSYVFRAMSEYAHGQRKIKHFVIYLRRNCIIDKCDAVNILRKIYDTESNIECELIACASDSIVYDAVMSCGLHDSFLSKRSGRCHDSWTYARESNGIHLLTILKPFSNDGFIHFFLRIHKSLRKILIERCVVWEAIKTKAQNLWSLENKCHRIFFL